MYIYQISIFFLLWSFVYSFINYSKLNILCFLLSGFDENRMSGFESIGIRISRMQWFLETDLHYRGWYFSETELKQKQKQEKDNEHSETTSDAC